MISENYVTFFQELEKNNTKEWFHENKTTYEKEVKNPFLGLLDKIIQELIQIEPGISPHSKDALFRINRDLRFSKDKTPYHTLLKAGFAVGGKKSVYPGYYLGISAEKIHVGGGLFQLRSADLKKVRSLIAKETDAFLQIINQPSFVSSFGALKGEKSKRLDPTVKASLEKTPFVANKQFYAMKEIVLNDWLNSALLHNEIMSYFKEISPLNQFLKKAFL